MMVLSLKELKAKEKTRDIDAEILKGMSDVMAGISTEEFRVEVPDVVAARQSTGLTQSAFAELLGVSKRTLQEWEQARKTPSKAAQSLIKIAMRHPEVLRELQEA
jgi:putative transcriptional regulator